MVKKRHLSRLMHPLSDETSHNGPCTVAFFETRFKRSKGIRVIHCNGFVDIWKALNRSPIRWIGASVRAWCTHHVPLSASCFHGDSVEFNNCSS